MRLLGIDPGLRVTGYGCVEGDPFRPRIVEAGVFRLARATVGAGAAHGQTPGERRSAASISARLVELERDVVELLERTKPEAVAVEGMFAHPKHPATVITMAHGRGVVLLAIRRAGLPLIELKPAEAKKSLTGNGQAKKEQVQGAVQRLFGLADPPSPADVADALAIAVCALQRRV